MKESQSLDNRADSQICARIADSFLALLMLTMLLQGLMLLQGCDVVAGCNVEEYMVIIVCPL